jgi:broad specificity phosphatase PhoE
MKIILLRHGKPKIDLHSMLKDRYASADLENLIDSYNLVGLSDDNRISDEVIKMSTMCNAVIHSDLLRSIESAKALGLSDTYHYCNAIFREPTPPFLDWKRPKLKLFTWFILFRTLWYLGYSNNSESISSARKRAALGVTKLKMFAKKYDTVLLVGHGFINRLIAKELLSSGWKGPKTPGNNYWEYGVYEYSK